MPAPAWVPPADALSTTNVGRFMVANAVPDIHALRARSIADPEWFWAAVVDFLGIEFAAPYDKVLDTSAGIPWAKWFTGGSVNVSYNCVSRHALVDPARRALVWEGEDGDIRMWTYGELERQSSAFAELLLSRGVKAGDAVGVFLPMLPETVAALMGAARIGAVFLPLFSGYAAAAVASRLDDASAVALVTADGFFRRGSAVAMIETALEAADRVASVRSVVVVPRIGHGGVSDDRVVAWRDAPSSGVDTSNTDSEQTLFVAYTSGTTGPPKGSVHVHGGFLVKIAEEVAFQCDVGEGDLLFWFTDMGWIMGPWEVVGGLAAGASILLYEGAPDYPAPDRLWHVVERHRVTVLGISPTLVRALMQHGDAVVREHDLSSLRVLGSTGEPWNEDPWRWYFDVVGGGRCPVINISGGTEVGACFLSPHPVEPIKPMSLGGPALGMAVDVFDDSGRPVRGQVGELVCTKPWPGMTRGLYRDADRYIETYWSRWPDVWVHGDWASIDADGDWFLHGRSDDTIKVAGKRLGPAEVESVVVSHDQVVEAAAIGVPDEVKGEVLWVLAVLTPRAAPTDELRAEIADLVAGALGKSFRPSVVRFTTALPKTRNAKVVRRAVRAAVVGEDAGDLSALEDPSTVDAVRAAS